MYTSWNQASLGALEAIFGHECASGTLQDLRTQLNTLIDESWTPQPGDTQHVHAAWQNIGATARNLTHAQQFSKKIAVALEKTVSCKRIGMAVIGLEVPHAHVHLIPLNEMDEMRFQNKVTMTKEEFEILAREISSNL